MQDAERYAAAALKSACDRIIGAPGKTRNNTLNAECFGIGQLVGSGLFSYHEAEAALLAAAKTAEISRHEAEATVQSGLTGGMKKARDVSDLKSQTPPPKKKRTTADWAAQIYREAKPAAGTIAERYLREVRNITGPIPGNFCFHPNVWHKEAKRELPALIAPIMGLDQSLTRVNAVHVTFLDDKTAEKTSAKPQKKMFGSAKGSAVWLGEFGNHMLCAEGIEKGLACQHATNIPTAVGLSSTLLPSIVWPRGTQKVTLCADPNGAGEHAIARAAEAWAKDGIELFVCYPPTPGQDWDECAEAHVRQAISKAKRWQAPERSSEIVEFDRSASGEIIKNEGNVLRALHWSNIKLTYDVFAQRYLIEGLEGYGPSLTDDALDELYLLIQREYYFKPTKQDFDRIVLASARRNRFHPIKDYLEGLEWDGIDRIDEWLSTYGGADNNEYTRAVGRLILIAAVMRIYSPGCKFDQILILEGDQGTGKSSAVATLSPDEAWFSDSMSLSASEKIVLEQTAGKWIIEIGELSGIGKREIEHVKEFLSRRADCARLSFGRMLTERPRQFLMIGTTNEASYLKDDTGNRRFWPVRTERFDLDGLKRDRDLLWAEAVYYAKRGESLVLPSRLWIEANREQVARRQEDEWEGVVADWLHKQLEQKSLSLTIDGYRTTIGEVAKGALDLDVAKLDPMIQKRLIRCMRAAGWGKAERSNGRNYWRPAMGAEPH